MILYGVRASPFVRKVLMYAAERGVEMKVVAAGLGTEPEGFAEASPFGKIPALADGDFRLADSSAIIAYLEAKESRAPSLIPHAAEARGRCIWFEEYADTILFPTAVKIFFNRVVGPLLGRPHDPAVADRAVRDELPPLLDYLEEAIPASGFLVEDRLTLADLAVVSPLRNLRMAEDFRAGGAYPRIGSHMDAIFDRPAIREVLAREAAQLERGRLARAG